MSASATFFNSSIGIKKIRFATPEEMKELAGIMPGCMLPFAQQIFPNIPLLIVASALREEDSLVIEGLSFCCKAGFYYRLFNSKDVKHVRLGHVLHKLFKLWESLDGPTYQRFSEYNL